MVSHPDAALLILGHGSTENPDSSDPTWHHVQAIRKLGPFAEVHCAFWKEEPTFRQIRPAFDSREIYVVPNFISEGYFTQEVIPRELELTGRTTVFSDGTMAHYCDPVGIHPSMTDLLLRRAREIAGPDTPLSETSLIVAGHGTSLNANSAAAIRDQVGRIREREPAYAEVLDAYMEETPFVADWDRLASAPNVVVVPFFISDGLHSYQDIPVMLGIEDSPSAAASRNAVFRQNPRRLRDRTLFYSGAIGADPSMVGVILDQVAWFDAHHRDPAAALS